MVLALAAAGASAAPSPGARTPPIARPKQELVKLIGSHRVFDVLPALDAHRAPTRIVEASRPLTGAQTVLPVVGHATTADGAGWLRVMIPGRPNGTSGWIEQRGTVLSSTSWRVLVRTSTRRVLVYRANRLVRSFAAIVGKPSTPTPHGQFFVEESVRMLPTTAGAPYALALSARSGILRTYEGGTGQVAIHGMANLTGTLGTASSHGCVRLSERSIRWLAVRIGPGVRVTIAR
jgi:lipoprotein-anchoring transpeptidase ErfK/SrfK